MGFKKRLAAALLLAAVAFLTFGIARSGMQVSEKQEEKFPAFTLSLIHISEPTRP